METLTDKEINDLYNAYKLHCNIEQAKPLEKLLRIYFVLNEDEHNIEWRDLTHIRNFKGRKGEHEADFLIYNIAVIETKNWDCFKRCYSISVNNAKGEILNRFTKYSKNLKRILVIANPIWAEGAKEYLLNNSVHIIELGFVVTESNISDAFDLVETAMSKLLFPSENSK